MERNFLKLLRFKSILKFILKISILFYFMLNPEKLQKLSLLEWLKVCFTLLIFIKPTPLVITSKDHQATGKIKNTNFQRVKKVEINGYEEFFAEFPGMKDYIDEEKLKQKTKDVGPLAASGPRRKRVIDDNHFCLAFWLFIVLVIFHINTFVLKSQVNQYYHGWSSEK